MTLIEIPGVQIEHQAEDSECRSLALINSWQRVSLMFVVTVESAAELLILCG